MLLSSWGLKLRCRACAALISLCFWILALCMDTSDCVFCEIYVRVVKVEGIDRRCAFGFCVSFFEEEKKSFTPIFDWLG